MEVIKTKQLNKYFKKSHVLKDINLTVHKGEICALIGKNGAGKTTLMKAIIGLTNCQSGAITLFGDQEYLKYNRLRIGSIIETPGFYPYLSGLENLEYFRIQRGILEKGVVEESLKMVDLYDERHKKIGSYSLGMKQRLGLALALLGSPDLLILDEPTNGIDAEGIVEIRNLLVKINQEKHITILISSHILAELANIGTKFCFMHKGALIKEVTATQLQEMTGNRIIIQVEEPKAAVVSLEKYMDFNNIEIQPNHKIVLKEFDVSKNILEKILIQHDIKLNSFTKQSVTLEDYFLEFIKEEENE
ncbi:ATP-binding cassette domain-containing protein [Alkaliphilus transvaalensis]|uniref:ATP-binding cassette domain-containing protein n=1 Tax=Alkaliphilus transvaalensis TaxID=114628 RepID=UPI00047A26CD|nr:ATP-binding cassette domain-containing protein [Alkaliphilus transvaalensis]